jgi:hypothetical protein
LLHRNIKRGCKKGLKDSDSKTHSLCKHTVVAPSE